MSTKAKIGLSLVAIGIVIDGWLLWNKQSKDKLLIQDFREKDEIAGLTNIVPQGWILKSMDNVITVTSIKSCERYIYQRSIAGPIGKEEIYPSVAIIFENLFDQEKIERNEEYVEKWNKSPAAISPPCKPIFANTKKYTVFVSSESCTGEDKRVINLLKAYFNKE